MTNHQHTQQRDELAEIIDRPEHFYDTGSHDEISAMEAAEAVWAAGYRKLRTVTEVADLDALPAGAAILDSRNVVWVNDGDDYEQWASLAEQNKEGGPIWVSSVEVPFPATVLYSPEAGE